MRTRSDGIGATVAGEGDGGASHFETSECNLFPTFAKRQICTKLLGVINAIRPISYFQSANRSRVFVFGLDAASNLAYGAVRRRFFRFAFSNDRPRSVKPFFRPANDVSRKSARDICGNEASPIVVFACFLLCPEMAQLCAGIRDHFEECRPPGAQTCQATSQP